MSIDFTNPVVIATIVLAIVVIAGAIVKHIRKRSLYNKLVGLLDSGSYDEFFRLVDSDGTRSLPPRTPAPASS